MTFFFFSSRRRHTRFKCDWSSDVCSSDLLHRSAVNLTSLARWDSEKRRISLALSMPIYGDPSLRLRLYADARNENWNLAQTFLGAGTPLTDLNMRRAAAGAEVLSIMTGRGSWSAGADIANRNSRNLT